MAWSTILQLQKDLKRLRKGTASKNKKNFHVSNFQLLYLFLQCLHQSSARKFKTKFSQYQNPESLLFPFSVFYSKSSVGVATISNFFAFFPFLEYFGEFSNLFYLMAFLSKFSRFFGVTIQCNSVEISVSASHWAESKVRQIAVAEIWREED